MKNSEIYLVRGESGEYDSWVSWNVKAFASSRKANAFARKLRKIVNDEKPIHLDILDNIVDTIVKYDPNCDVQITGVKYEVVPIQFIP